MMKQVSLHTKPELFDEVILPGAFDMRTQFADDLNEMHEQLQKQVTRLKELWMKKVEQPGASSPQNYRPLFPRDAIKMPSMARRTRICTMLM